MDRPSLCVFVASVGVVVCLSHPASAQTPVPAGAPVTSAPSAGVPQVQQVREELDRLKLELESIRQQYDQRISILEQRIGDLSGPNVIAAPAAASVPAVSLPEPAAQAQTPPPPVPAVPATTPVDQSAGQSAAPQNAAGSGKVFNPDTSVIGNFLGVAGKNPSSTQPSMQLSEVEVAFQAIVDPYAKADFFLSASPEGLEVEEGFLTFNSLPAGLLVKVGKMREQFGKVNTMHTHILPWADRPLVLQNLVGGDEGISDAGVSVSKLIPNRVMFLEATGELFRGTSPVFDSSNQRSRLNYVERLRAYRDLSEGSNLDVGVSFSQGYSNEWPDYMKELSGIDATFRYRPLRRAIYHRFIARTEMVWSRQEAPAWATTAFGWYGSADYQFARRWYIGARADRSGRAAHVSGTTDSGGSVYLTFWPSEFSQIRGQYRRTNYAEGISANELLFQFNFSIGAHGAHAF